MRILLCNNPVASPAQLALSAEILAAAKALGFDARADKIEASALATQLGVQNGEPSCTADTMGSALTHGILTEFRPNVVIGLSEASQADSTKAALATVRDCFVVSYTLHMAPTSTAGESLLHLINLNTGKHFRIAHDDHEKLINIVASEAVSSARLPPNGISPADPVFDSLAEAEIGLRRYASVLPYRRDELRRNPEITVAGALETLVDDEIVLGESLWLKGWIDWDEKQYARLIAQVGSRVTTLELGGFRADKFEAGAVQNPLSFETEIDLTGVFSRTEIKLVIEDKQGLQLDWIKRAVWFSRPGSAHSRTPLITGEAHLEKWRVSCDIDCDGVPASRIVAWQDGCCIGRWSGPAASHHSSIAFDIHPVNENRGLIHLHVHLHGRGDVSWLSLSPKTGAPVDFVEAPVAGAAVENDLFTHKVDGQVEKFPVSLYLDGKLIGAMTAPSVAKISLKGCSGAAVVEAVFQDTTRQALRCWRHRLQIPGEDRLPAFVLPPAMPADTYSHRRRKCPKILLIRQTSAPTDELYVIAALEEIAKDREFDLHIVDLQADETTQEERNSLLSTGTFVIVSRYLTPDWIEAIGRHRSRLGQIYYIMDDDVTLAENDISMPGGYRKRMIKVANSEFQTLLHLGTRFLVTSQFLKQRFSSAKTDLITPPYIRPRESMSHLDDLSEIRIEYHGTQLHRADLDAISSALQYVHNKYRNVRIRTFMGRSAPNRLKQLERVEIVPDIPWEDYKAAVAESPAHIALAPMLESPYNKAKSFVKIMDVARLGAVGLYSKRPPFEEVITHGENGFLLENDALLWRYALCWLVENPDEIRKTALAAQVLAKDLGNIERLRKYWQSQIFGPRSLAVKKKSTTTRGKASKRKTTSRRSRYGRSGT